MGIGVLALAFSVVMAIMCLADLKTEPKRQEQKKVVYPYPSDLY